MKFGVREICDVTFKTTAAGQKVGNTVFAKAGMPAFFIDTAKTSSLEQATSTVYAQGGKGYNRLIAWEGEKTMTFTVEDALISPMGLAVLSGAGLVKANANNKVHVHVTIDAAVNDKGEARVTLADLQEETGKTSAKEFLVCNYSDVPVYATVIDGSGAGVEFVSGDIAVKAEAVDTDSNLQRVTASTPAVFTLNENYANQTVKLDFYLAMNSGVTNIEIKPQDFGGFFYVEAQTLFRREDTGLDMAAEIILPKVKVQSGFTFSMAASGDPSTFTFTMDAFPGYTMFDRTKKVMCVMQVIGEDDTVTTSNTDHEHNFLNPSAKGIPTVKGKEEFLANSSKVDIIFSGNAISVEKKAGETLKDDITSTEGKGTGAWVALDINTGMDDIKKVKYDGNFLTDKDVADAKSLGLDNGHFVLWINYNEVIKAAKKFTLSTETDTKSMTVYCS